MNTMPLGKQLDRINTSYLLQTDLKLLHDELVSLDAVIANKALYEDRRESAKALRLRLDAKICLLKYADGFNESDYLETVAHCDANIAVATGKYANTVIMLQEVKAIAESLYAVTKDVWQHRQLLKGNNSLVFDVAHCNAATESVALAMEKLVQCNLEVTAPNLRLGDLRKQALDFLEFSRESFSDARKNIIAKKIVGATKDITHYKDNQFFPLPEHDEGGKANVLVLSTPLVEDARLFAVNQLPEGRKLLCLSVYGLTDKSIEFFKSLLGYLVDTGDYCIFEGVETLPLETCDAVLVEAMRVGKMGAKLYLTDTTGKAQLYSQALNLATKSDNTASVTDVSLEYISLPIFEQVKQLFEEMELADPTSSGEILKKMPFMGFDGLNKLIRATANKSKPWQDVGKRVSSANRQAVLRYLENVPAVYLIIDSGWGDFSEYEKHTAGADGEFDYDGVDSVNLKNVKLIVESNESIFSKCGMIARYCTIGSDDVSAWEKIERDEKQERIKMAVKLVYRILRVDIDPIVELLDELDNPTAGGLCYDGGKRIAFRYDCAKSVGGWLWGAIVHECFHSLQSKLTHGAWHEWYYMNMGITRGRVSEWRKTREVYDHNTNSNLYKVHIYEADARAFEVDCDDGRNKAWNTMNFE